MREKLIKLIREAKDEYPAVPTINCCKAEFANFLADRLLENGVIVPPCKVGDTVYYINTLYFSQLERNRVYRAEVTRIVITKRSVSFVAKVRYMGGVIEITEDGLGKNVFLTREEAEQALKGGSENDGEIEE